VIEIASFPHGQLFTVSIGEFVQLSRRFLRPNRGVKVSKRVDQLIGFSDDTNERSTFAEGFHGGYTDGLDGVSGEGYTGTKAVKCGWRADVIVAITARSVPLQREQQIERFAAFKHPDRIALASFVYESSPWGCARMEEFKFK